MAFDDAELVLDAGCTLGEGPVWWNGCAWFVDIEGPALHRFCPTDDEHEVFGVPERVGFAVPSTKYGWVIAQGASVSAFRPGEGGPRRLAEVEPEDHGTRMNDGKCDPAGRLFAGTMRLACDEAIGSLYRFGADARPMLVERGVKISNGLAWDAGRRVMYYIDTATGRIDAFDWDEATGSVSGRRPIATLERGWPDGMSIDREGRLWVAMWEGGRVACVDPGEGREVGSIAVGCPHVTSCCFGGDDLDRLYITTARIGLDEAALREHPQSGGLFVAEPGVTGSATTAMV